MARETYRCLYCDLTVESADAWIEHLSSEEHKEKFFSVLSQNVECDSDRLNDIAGEIVRSAHDDE